MFEENNSDVSNARRNNQAKQCRIQKYISNGSIFDGNCTCWCPNQCYFNLHKHVPELDPTMMWPDIKQFYRDLSTE